MRLVIYIILAITISNCQTKETNNTCDITGKGKVFYVSDYMKKNDGRLDVEFVLSKEGILLSKIDYDTGPKRLPSASKYKFNELIIERIDLYDDNNLYLSEYFDKKGNLIKYIPSNLRDSREELHINYEYDANNYPLVERKNTLYFYKDSLLKSDTTIYLYDYNDNHTLRTCKISNDTSVNIKEYTFDERKNILKECAYKKGIKSKYIIKHLYDDKDRIIMKGKGDFQNVDDKLMSYTNHWEYKYNDQNLITELKLYLYGELQYTIAYTYDNLDLLKVKSIPKEMIKFMLKN